MPQQVHGYRFIRKINQGGMSTVYLAVQLSMGREVALKVMAPALNADPVFSERFQREANIVGQLSHPNIVSIYDIGRHENLNYIAMDYLSGGSVYERMKTGISDTEALAITGQIARALDHAHERGYIHRDIKPGNILFREDGSAVLTDFGVAKTLDGASHMTMAGTVVGTPHYMSPEQARGKPLDGRADLYGLGVVLYEMLTGTVPFRADEPVAVAVKHLTSAIPKLPEHLAYLQPLVNKMLAKDADDRFQRGRDIAEAIQSLREPGASEIRPDHAIDTDPTAVQILSLLKALLQITGNAVYLKTRAIVYWLASWRYSREAGLHRTRASASTDTLGDLSATYADQPTLVHQAPQTVAQSGHRKSRILASLAAAAVLFAGSWLAASYWGAREPDPAGEKPNADPAPAAVEKRPQEPQSRDPVSAPDSAAEPVGIEPPLQDTEALFIEPDPEPAVRGPETPPAPAEPPPPPRFALRVEPTPPGARVRILNIRERYFPGIELIPGNYHVEVTRRGYDPYLQWIELGSDDRTLQVSLRKTPIPGATFHNTLANGENGPEMVIVPAGSFTMGDRGQASTSPLHKVTIAKPFAVSRYEITFVDYRKYTYARGLPLPDDNRWGGGSRPVINISWQDAQGYVAWLRAQTGKKYRLLSESEWEYVARANSRGDFYWQETTDASSREPLANCRRGCFSPFTRLLRMKTAPVGSFPGNSFKLHDTAGNVAEWVQDCYQNHYLGVPDNGSAVDKKTCPQRVTRGGSLRANISGVTSHGRDPRDPDLGYPDVGLRVAVDLY